MKIAFDAKRAYQNGTGLGHYSRTLISSLATFYPEHQYYLCAPKLTDRYDLIGIFTGILKFIPVNLYINFVVLCRISFENKVMNSN